MSTRDAFIVIPSIYGDSKTLYIRGEWSRSIDSVIEHERINHVVIEEWKERTVAVLHRYSGLITRLWITCEIKDVTAISDLVNLVDLYLSTPAASITFSNLKNLQILGLEDQAIPDNLSSCLSLKKLTLISVCNNDLSAVSGLRNLTELVIRESNLKSLKGVEQNVLLRCLVLAQMPLDSLNSISSLGNLQEIHLVRLSKLRSLHPLEQLKSLSQLNISSCKNIMDYRLLSKCISLKQLSFENMAIPDIAFIKSLASLEVFKLLERSNVVDGDLSPLLKLPRLTDVFFNNRRHYSHRWDAFNTKVKHA